jgi:hypothetical protein
VAELTEGGGARARGRVWVVLTCDPAPPTPTPPFVGPSPYIAGNLVLYLGHLYVRNIEGLQSNATMLAALPRAVVFEPHFEAPRRLPWRFGGAGEGGEDVGGVTHPVLKMGHLLSNINTRGVRNFCARRGTVKVIAEQRYPLVTGRPTRAFGVAESGGRSLPRYLLSRSLY